MPVNKAFLGLHGDLTWIQDGETTALARSMIPSGTTERRAIHAPRRAHARARDLLGALPR